jgi:hypothetical protein
MSAKEIELTGTIRYIDMGMGTWALVVPNTQQAQQARQYELLQPAPAQLMREGLEVTITGTIRDDVMTMAAIGPVLEVREFQVIDT